MPASPFFICEWPGHERSLARLLRSLPPLSGRPIRVETGRGLRDLHGEVHAGSFLRERRIALNCHAREFPRIFMHELFHFVWLRLGNARRREYERLLEFEIASGTRGELGWSAEWRKRKLTRADLDSRTRRWREYCCESFCDTAAWLYSGAREHSEFTLGQARRNTRRRWFALSVGRAGLSI